MQTLARLRYRLGSQRFAWLPEPLAARAGCAEGQSPFASRTCFTERSEGIAARQEALPIFKAFVGKRGCYDAISQVLVQYELRART